ncbi:cation:proton antiporter subunit C [Candidatus Bipolaricaulota bacterium]
MAFTIAVILISIGVAVAILRRDLVIKLLAVGLINAGSILALVSLGDRPGAQLPIRVPSAEAVYADPLPQAAVLSAIVINFALLALALVFVMRLVEYYHSTDSDRIEDQIRREEEEEL